MRLFNAIVLFLITFVSLNIIIYFYFGDQYFHLFDGVATIHSKDKQYKQPIKIVEKSRLTIDDSPVKSKPITRKTDFYSKSDLDNFNKLYQAPSQCIGDIQPKYYNFCNNHRSLSFKDYRQSR